MRLVSKTFTFLSIGFVLVFFGKINKVNLYHAFFKTIEEIQIRNSVGLEGNQVVFSSFDADDSPKSGLHQQLDFKVFGLKTFFAAIQPDSGPLQTLLSQSVSLPPLLFHLFSNPPRAP